MSPHETPPPLPPVAPHYTADPVTGLAGDMLGYLLIVAGMVGMCLLACFLVVMERPDRDNMSILTLLVGFTATSVGAILAFLTSLRNRDAINKVHVSLNSRLSEWMAQAEAAKEAATRAAYAAGVSDQLQGKPSDQGKP